MMKAKAIRELNDQQIKDKILVLCQERLNLRMSIGSNPKLPTARFKLIREEIARLKTILAERTKK
jgi:large subunit ribosomal protein L29|tara:strand:- start:367 stop:561 length:195 start_codon:yes stop_codon:yes gene_type:complete